MTATIHTLKQPAKQILRLRIELADVEPLIWREIWVPDTITLSKLHSTILYGMGWEGGHIHEFEFGDLRYGRQEPGWEYEGVKSEARVTLKKALAGGNQFSYIYDLGDHWEHRIQVIPVTPAEASLKRKLPVCVAGENACPPEDVGGAWGYVDFVVAITDPTHEDHENMLEWCGGEFDPRDFDLGATNESLSEIKL